jgi:hypothetical protein
MQDPWAIFGEKTFDFCEEYLAGWVHAPLNAWTNLAYVAAGIVILFLYLRRRNAGPGSSWLMAPIAALIGITSFLFHASGTYFFQVFDLSSMFLFTSYLMVTNIVRITGKKKLFVPLFIASMVVTITGTLILRQNLAGILFDLEIAVALVIEYLLRRRGFRAPSYRPLFLSLGLFLLAWIPWFLDFARVVCDPQNHLFQLHALWHFITAAALVFAFLFYRRIEEQAAAAGI